MNKKIIIYLLIFIFLIRLILAIDLDDCKTSGWDYGETYYLTTDIVPDELICMDIDANNVVLDCQWNSISGNIGTIGISLNGVSDVTIKNCILDSLLIGLEMVDSSDNIFINIIADNNQLEGIKKTNSNNDYFDRIRACNNGQEDPGSYYDLDDQDQGNDYTINMMGGTSNPPGIFMFVCSSCDNIPPGFICINNLLLFGPKIESNPSPKVVPEFSTIGTIITLLVVSIGIFLVMRKRK